jgi:hypothetical protein
LTSVRGEVVAVAGHHQGMADLLTIAGVLAVILVGVERWWEERN